MKLVTVYHKPTMTFHIVSEEEAEVITNIDNFRKACRYTPPGVIGFDSSGSRLRPTGVVRFVYNCCIGEITEMQVKNRDYRRLPNTPAAKVLFFNKDK